ncbi:cytochrome P450, partial [Aureobasidium melanogenum]
MYPPGDTENALDCSIGSMAYLVVLVILKTDSCRICKLRFRNCCGNEETRAASTILFVHAISTMSFSWYFLGPSATSPKPQLLDAHLKTLLPPIVEAYLAFLQVQQAKSPSSLTVSLDVAASKLTYTFCKVRGEKIIIGFLNNEPRYLELVLANLEDFRTLSAESDTAWEKSYVLLLWLTHLMLVPFDLSSISAVAQPPEVHEHMSLQPQVPSIARRIIALGIHYLASATREQDAAAKMLVRLVTRPDMQRLELPAALVSWALMKLLNPSASPNSNLHTFLGPLRFLTGMTVSVDTPEVASLMPSIYSVGQRLMDDAMLAFLSSSAVTKKLVVKLLRNMALLSLQCPFDGLIGFLEASNVLEETIDYCLQSLEDRDTPVRFAASKALSMIILRLDPEMGHEVIQAVLESFKEDMPKSSSKPDFGAANALRWHGLTLTLAHALFRRSASPQQLPEILNALLLALSFEQRSAVGVSTGSNVRDAACFGIWSLSRRYTTKELLSTDTSQIGFEFCRDAVSIIQVVAIQLLLSACLDPSGNIRRGSSAALQELIGRHPDQVSNGISLVQVVDYHAVGLRQRAMVDVAQDAASLDTIYREALLVALGKWRGLGSTDVLSREAAAESIGLLCAAQLPQHVCITLENLQQCIFAFPNSDVEQCHGSLLALSKIIDTKMLQLTRGDNSDSSRKNMTYLLSLWKIFDEEGHLYKNQTLRATRAELPSATPPSRKFYRVWIAHDASAPLTEWRIVGLQAVDLMIQADTIDADILPGVLSALDAGLNDYTITERGDVGSLTQIDAGSRHLLEGNIIRLSLEKMDRVRLQAARCLKQDLNAKNVSDMDVSSYQYFLKLFTPLIYDPPSWKRDAILKGSISCAGVGAEGLLRASRMALVDTLSRGSDSVRSDCLSALTNCLRELIAKEAETQPLLELIAYLLDALPSIVPLNSPFNWRVLLSLVQKAHFKSNNISRILAAIEVYQALAEKPTARVDTLKKLVSMLRTNPYPTVRTAVAECLFLATGDQALKIIDWNKPSQAYNVPIDVRCLFLPHYPTAVPRSGVPTELYDLVGYALFVVAQANEHPIRFISIVLLLLPLSYFVTNEFIRKNARIPGFNGPPGKPVFGNIPDIKYNAAEKYREWSKTYGDVYQIQLGNIPVIVCNSAEACRVLFGHFSQALSSRPVFYTFHKVLSNTAGTTIGTSPFSDSLKRRRKGAASALNKPSVASYVGHLDVETLAFVKEGLEYGAAGTQSVDPMPMIQRLSLSLALTLNWGTRLSSRDDPLFHEITEVEEEISKFRSTSGNMQDYVPFLRLNPFNAGSTRAREMRQRRDVYLTKLNKDLDDRMAKGTHKPCIQANVIQDKEAKLNKEELTSISLTMLSGGLDTVTTLVAWSIALLGQRPDIQEKAIREIRKMFSEDEILCAPEDEMKCEYVMALVKECLRYYTVLRLALPRATVKDITYEGKLIPAGTTIYLNAWACNMDPAVWKDPEVFRPERWLEQPDAPLFTYGVGYRMCAGSLLANRELYLVFMRMLSCFEIEKGTEVETHPVKGSSDPTSLVSLPHRYEVRFRPRNKVKLREQITAKEKVLGEC